MKIKRNILRFVIMLSTAVPVCADLSIDLVNIGNAGNPADGNGRGSVGYDYQISKYELTVAQYTEFLNAKACSDPYGLYNESMETDPMGASILRSGQDGSYTYTAVSGKENQPARWLCLFDGMRLCNWMHNGQGDGDTETGAYNMSGGFYTERLSLATWAIASEDEWYKAAYYDPDAGVYYDYPNGTDDVPAEPIDQTSPRVFNFGDDPYWAPDGPLHRLYFTSTGDTTGRSPYGTYDQGGNAREWTDTMDIAPYRHYRYVRGGTLFTPESYLRSDTYNAYHPDEEGYFALRMVHLIPEPSTALLVLSGLLVMGLLRRRRG